MPRPFLGVLSVADCAWCYCGPWNLTLGNFGWVLTTCGVRSKSLPKFNVLNFATFSNVQLAFTSVLDNVVRRTESGALSTGANMTMFPRLKRAACWEPTGLYAI
ncbi:hypothetical protein D3C86_1501540 [compost metagenome]